MSIIFLVMLAAISIKMAFDDIRHLKIFNHSIASTFILFISLYTFTIPHVDFYPLGSLITFILLTFFHIAVKGSFGMGDVKLLSCVALVVGPINTWIILLLACFTALIYVLILCIKGITTTNRRIPFVPFIVIGILAIVFAEFAKTML